MKLAERASVSWLLGAVAIGTLALVVPQLGGDHAPPKKTRGCRMPAKLEAPPAPESCPAAVRAQLHVDADATVLCLKQGWMHLAFAYYHTTEWWERTAAIGEDGTVVTPLVDQPRLWHDGDVVEHALADGVAIRQFIVGDSFRFEATPIAEQDVGVTRISAPGSTTIADYDWSRVCDLGVVDGRLAYTSMHRECPVSQRQTFLVRAGTLVPMSH